MRPFLIAGSGLLIFGLIILSAASRGGIGSDIALTVAAIMCLIGTGLIILSVYDMTTKKKRPSDKK